MFKSIFISTFQYYLFMKSRTSVLFFHFQTYDSNEWNWKLRCYTCMKNDISHMVSQLIYTGLHWIVNEIFDYFSNVWQFYTQTFSTTKSPKFQFSFLKRKKLFERKVLCVEFSSCVTYEPNFEYFYRTVLEILWSQEIVLWLP